MIRSFAGAACLLAFAAVPAGAADDAALARMAMCRDSWLDWSKTAPAEFKQFADRFRADFSRHDDDPYFLPHGKTSVAGLRIVEAFPDSVGMGVGFSLTLAADYGTTRKIMEAALGKPLTKCEASDGTHSCELPIADQRTFILIASDNDNTKTLIGCYYFYEK